MTLKEWLKKHNVKPYIFAQRLQIAPSTIYNAIHQTRRLSPKYAVMIETFTKGEVSRTEALWPEYIKD